MTTIEDPSAPVTERAERGWIPAWSRFTEILRDGVVIAALTFVLGAITTTLLEDWVETRVIPYFLQKGGIHQRMELYKKTADGKVMLDACYNLYVNPWSTKLAGRMIEIVDPKECAAAPTNEPNLEPLEFKTSGSWAGGIMSGAFRHLEDSDFGGGSFSVVNTKGTGIYVGSMGAQGHDPGKGCVLMHYLVAIGKPKHQGAFQNSIENMISETGSNVAMLPNLTTNGSCKVAENSTPK